MDVYTTFKQNKIYAISNYNNVNATLVVEVE